MKTEIFLPIKGYEGIYEISNHGNVKSLPRIDCGGIKRKERILKQSVDKYGYSHLSLNKNKISKNFFVHRLVAVAFIPNPNNLPEVNHIFGNKSDNYFENIEWCTQSINAKHSRRIGLHPEIAETHKWATLTNTQVLEIFNNPLAGVEIAKLYNVNPLIVSRIKTGKQWSSVTGKIYIQKKVA